MVSAVCEAASWSSFSAKRCWFTVRTTRGVGVWVPSTTRRPMSLRDGDGRVRGMATGEFEELELKRILEATVPAPPSGEENGSRRTNGLAGVTEGCRTANIALIPPGPYVTALALATEAHGARAMRRHAWLDLGPSLLVGAGIIASTFVAERAAESGWLVLAAPLLLALVVVSADVLSPESEKTRLVRPGLH